MTKEPLCEFQPQIFVEHLGQTRKGLDCRVAFARFFQSLISLIGNSKELRYIALSELSGFPELSEDNRYRDFGLWFDMINAFALPVIVHYAT